MISTAFSHLVHDKRSNDFGKIDIDFHEFENALLKLKSILETHINDDSHLQELKTLSDEIYEQYQKSLRAPQRILSSPRPISPPQNNKICSSNIARKPNSGIWERNVQLLTAYEKNELGPAQVFFF